jgi:peptidoglycan hydrolase CwlO-like protein
MGTRQSADGWKNAAMDRRAIDDLRRLAAQDDEQTARERRLQELDATARQLRERAETLESFFAEYDEAEQRVLSAVEAVEAEAARRREQVAEAEAALAAERDEERRGRARTSTSRSWSGMLPPGNESCRTSKSGQRDSRAICRTSSRPATAHRR